jgi:tetratricopeptide (TPR) repeat protein
MARKAQDDPQFEISFYEKLLARRPNFVEALICLGDLYTREGFLEKGLDVDQRLARLRPDDETVFYNLACSYSLMNDVAASEKAMRRAIALGYRDWDHLARDPDLLNLLNRETFRSYFLGLRARCGSVAEKRRG